MSSLLERLKAARECRFESGGIKIIYSRPTELQILRIGRTHRIESFIDYIVGWEGVKESDLYATGDATAAEYDHEVALLWLSDNLTLFNEFSTAVIAAYEEHKKTVSDSKKK